MLAAGAEIDNTPPGASVAKQRPAFVEVRDGQIWLCPKTFHLISEAASGRVTLAIIEKMFWSERSNRLKRRSTSFIS
jgi:hypothetical protein